MELFIAGLSEWQLDLLIPVKNVRRERIRLLPSKSLGPAHLFFFTRTVADRTKAALIFRLRNSTSENIHWISSRGMIKSILSVKGQTAHHLASVPPARDERFLSNKVEMNLERCIEGDRLVLSSIEAIKSTVSKTKTKQSFSIDFGDEGTPTPSIAAWDASNFSLTRSLCRRLSRQIRAVLAQLSKHCKGLIYLFDIVGGVEWAKRQRLPLLTLCRIVTPMTGPHRNQGSCRET